MIVEIALEPTYPVLPKWGESQLRVYNGRDCDYSIGVGNINFQLPKNSFHLETISVPSDNLIVSLSASTNSPGCTGFTESIVLESGKSNGIFIERSRIIPFEDSNEKSRQGRPAVRVLTNYPSNIVELKDKNETFIFDSIKRQDVLAGEYSIIINGRQSGSGYKLKLGGVYTFIVNERGTNDFVRFFFFKFIETLVLNFFIYEIFISSLAMKSFQNQIP